MTQGSVGASPSEHTLEDLQELLKHCLMLQSSVFSLLLSIIYEELPPSSLHGNIAAPPFKDWNPQRRWLCLVLSPGFIFLPSSALVSSTHLFPVFFSYSSPQILCPPLPVLPLFLTSSLFLLLSFLFACLCFSAAFSFLPFLHSFPQLLSGLLFLLFCLNISSLSCPSLLFPPLTSSLYSPLSCRHCVPSSSQLFSSHLHFLISNVFLLSLSSSFSHHYFLLPNLLLSLCAPLLSCQVSFLLLFYSSFSFQVYFL